MAVPKYVGSYPATSYLSGKQTSARKEIRANGWGTACLWDRYRYPKTWELQVYRLARKNTDLFSDYTIVAVESIECDSPLVVDHLAAIENGWQVLAHKMALRVEVWA